MALILLRHTRPEAPQGLCYGITDLGLAPCFVPTATTIAGALPPVRRILSSPLQRCLRLAEHVARARNLRVDIDPRLAEMDFGHWEGQRWDDIPRAELDAWAADLLHARPHGGESVAQLRARSLAALRDHAGPETLVVTHHGVIKAARVQIMGDAGWQSELGFGKWLDFPPEVFRDDA